MFRKHQLLNATPTNISQTILIAEDSESDRILIQLGFERQQFPFSLQFVEDGLEAIGYLNGEGRYANRKKFPLPAILLTDLKMPRLDGLELLGWVRNQEKWRTLPVIVVTGSNQTEDWHRATELGANSYVVKDLLMRPPPTLLEAILRLTSPAPIDPRKAWAQRAKKVSK